MIRISQTIEVSHVDITRKANYYKRRFNSPDGLTLYQLYEIAEDLDIIFHSGSFGEMKGAYYYIERTKHIILSNTLSEIEEAFVLSHKLGHAIFHRTQTCFFNQRYAMAFKPRMEREADEFSAKILLPSQIPIDELSYYTLYQLASLYNVPAELMRIKLDLPK